MNDYLRLKTFHDLALGKWHGLKDAEYRAADAAARTKGKAATAVAREVHRLIALDAVAQWAEVERRRAEWHAFQDAAEPGQTLACTCGCQRTCAL